jgi:3-hydroxyisobutyryl-CoA hydrolase
MFPALRARERVWTIVRALSPAAGACSSMFSTAPVTPAAAEPLVLSSDRGNARFLTLNRPRALNALSLDMIRELTVHTKAFMNEKAINVVVLKGNAKAFCAGGDVRALTHTHTHTQEAFFREEYTLDYMLAQATETKPIVVIYEGSPAAHALPNRCSMGVVDRYVQAHFCLFARAHNAGICMGGGVGISINASVRVSTETSLFAMPETAIGTYRQTHSRDGGLRVY